MRFVVECKPDEALLRSLLSNQRSEVIHQINKPEVLKLVNKPGEAMGMVDADPDSIQPPIVSSLAEIESLPHLGLSLSTFPNHNKIVTITPRLEDWVLAASAQNGVNVERFGLPRNPESFHRIVNQRQANLLKLLPTLIQNERLQKLSEWLNSTL